MKKQNRAVLFRQRLVQRITDMGMSRSELARRCE